MNQPVFGATIPLKVFQSVCDLHTEQPHPLRQRIKHSPEDFLGEQQFILGRCAVAAPSRREAVELPVLLVVVG